MVSNSILEVIIRSKLLLKSFILSKSSNRLSITNRFLFPIFCNFPNKLPKEVSILDSSKEKYFLKIPLIPLLVLIVLLVFLVLLPLIPLFIRK